MQLTYIYNPQAGIEEKTELIRTFKALAFQKSWLFKSYSSFEWSQNKKEKLPSEEGIILIAGGDGTINKILKTFWEHHVLTNVVFGIIPSGTFNALAKNFPFLDVHQFMEALEHRSEQTGDLLELEFFSQQSGTRREIAHTGVFFAKHSRFTEEAALLKKAWFQKNFQPKVTFRNILSYLEPFPTFAYQREEKRDVVSGLYFANHPFLFRNQPLPFPISLFDRAFHVFSVPPVNHFELGQLTSVLFFGKSSDLPFLVPQKKISFQFRILEDIESNIDGDIIPLKKNTDVKITVSPQQVRFVSL